MISHWSIGSTWLIEARILHFLDAQCNFFYFMKRLKVSGSKIICNFCSSVLLCCEIHVSTIKITFGNICLDSNLILIAYQSRNLLGNSEISHQFLSIDLKINNCCDIYLRHRLTQSHSQVAVSSKYCIHLAAHWQKATLYPSLLFCVFYNSSNRRPTLISEWIHPPGLRQVKRDSFYTRFCHARYNYAVLLSNMY